MVAIPELVVFPTVPFTSSHFQVVTTKETLRRVVPENIIINTYLDPH